MTPAMILEECSQRGIRLSPHADKLVIEPASRLTDELRQAIRSAKAEILRLLPLRQIRPVFQYRLADSPHQPLVMLGTPGETLQQATASLRDRFGFARVLSVELYQWPPPPPEGKLQ